MKRAIILLVLLLLVVSPIVLAEGNLTNVTKEKVSALSGGLNDKTENILEREVTLPQLLKAPLEFALGIKDGATWQQLIIVLGMFIGFFILMLSTIKLIPLLEKGLVQILSALIITILASTTGSLNMVATFFFDLAGFFKWTASWGPLQMIVAIVFAIIVILGFNKIANSLEEKLLLQKVEDTGRNAHLVGAQGKAILRNLK